MGGAGGWALLGRAWTESPFSPQQRFQDTSQYVCAELQALEQEQRQIDGRAAEVESQLRSLMESGGVGTWSLLPSTCHQICLTMQPLLTLRGIGRKQDWGHHLHLQLGTLRP